MIVFGYPIHRKYNRLVAKIVAIIFFIIVAISIMSCNKLDFDPTTTTLKYMLKEKK